MLILKSGFRIWVQIILALSTFALEWRVWGRGKICFGADGENQVKLISIRTGWCRDLPNGLFEGKPYCHRFSSEAEMIVLFILEVLIEHLLGARHMLEAKNTE